MRESPIRRPRTSPVPVTVAAAGLVLAHSIAASIALPSRSRAVAASCRVSPSSRSALSGEIVIAARNGGDGASTETSSHAATKTATTIAAAPYHG